MSPNPLLKFLVARSKYWAEQRGLRFDGEVDAASDTPTAWSTAGGTIGQQHRNVKVLIASNDASALAASSNPATGGTVTPIVGIKGAVATNSNADSGSTVG